MWKTVFQIITVSLHHDLPFRVAFCSTPLINCFTAVSDIIGDEAHNQELSLARANEVKGILESALAKAGRTDVKFEAYGFGEDLTLEPFENKFPEERFYNHTVIIDIIPPK